MTERQAIYRDEAPVPRMTNLNELGIPSDQSKQAQENNRSAGYAHVVAIFRNHRTELMKVIGDARMRKAACFGAVAWLTDFQLLDALQKIETAIVVQKEDFLRPDNNMSGNPDWEKQLRQAYGKLKKSCERHQLPGLAGNLSVCGDPGFEPVRCVGERPQRGRANNPRMHNKFLVFAVPQEAKVRRPFPGGDDHIETVWHPYAVWTGSMNLTDTVDHSWENAVFIDSPDIARGYLDEWVQLFAMSEPLDWRSPYVEPEWRIGT